MSGLCFFFNDTATTEIYTLSLHDALPISSARKAGRISYTTDAGEAIRAGEAIFICVRSEEHTSELQSRLHLVCRLLLEKNKTAVVIFRADEDEPVRHGYGGGPTSDNLIIV